MSHSSTLLGARSGLVVLRDHLKPATGMLSALEGEAPTNPSGFVVVFSGSVRVAQI